jgi:pyrroline-5-carboxylate reductase
VPGVQIGFIGSGNMARSLARGWGEPVLCTDSGSGRATALAAELGGEALASNRELAERADLVILAHKPAQLEAVAADIAGATKAVVSILARATQADVRAAYPDTPVFCVEPNTPAEVGRGVLAFAQPDAPVDAELYAAVRDRFARLGTVVEIPERLMGVAGAILDFLRDVSEPYLRIFRRLPLRLGAFDFSPIVALLVLRIVGGIVVSLIAP